MKQYLDMMRHVRENGVYKEDRTGTGTYSVFAYQMRFDLSDGFPLVTTKLCHLKSIIHELLWFLNGDTNIRYLKANGVSIWDDWAIKGTEEYVNKTDLEIRDALLARFSVKKIGGIGVKNQPVRFDFSVEEETVYFNVTQEVWDETLAAVKGSENIVNDSLGYCYTLIAEFYGIETKRLVAGELGPVYGSQWRNWPVAQQSTVDALIELSCLGNGSFWGNSDGNVIAQRALLEIPGIRHNKRAFMSSGKTYGDWLAITKDDKNHYGFNGGIDQIKNMVEMIKNNPNSRRLLVSAWNPLEIEQMALPPCHCLFQFYTTPISGMSRWTYGLRNNYFTENQGRGYTGEKLEEFLDEKGVPDALLSCQLYQRSCDVFLGVPFNIASYALLTMMVAQVTGLGVGEFVWTGGDVHLYSNHLEQADLQLTRTPHKLPTMNIKNRGQAIDAFAFEDFELRDYVHDAAIKAPIAV